MQPTRYASSDEATASVSVQREHGYTVWSKKRARQLNCLRRSEAHVIESQHRRLTIVRTSSKGVGKQDPTCNEEQQQRTCWYVSNSEACLPNKDRCRPRLRRDSDDKIQGDLMRPWPKLDYRSVHAYGGLASCKRISSRRLGTKAGSRQSRCCRPCTCLYAHTKPPVKPVVVPRVPCSTRPVDHLVGYTAYLVARQTRAWSCPALAWPSHSSSDTSIVIDKL